MADRAAMLHTPTISLTEEHARLLQEGGLELFTALLDQGATAASLAERLSIPRARVNFILNRLVADGLVQVEAERTDGERIERTYRATAATFGLQAGQSSTVQERVAAAAYMTNRIHSGMIRAIALEQKNIAMHMARARVPASRLEEYIHRLGDLQAQFDSEASGGEDSWYTMAIALYPEGPDPDGGEA